ncbi:MAG: hypothetical protein IKL98_07735, partial [Akkermansia sp.]|nr:hypothetical protein [Akkermansia sp.]
MNRYNIETLEIEKTVVIDAEKPRDGYYAEQYFDGDNFCVVTYRITDSEAPDIILLRYDWNELK